MRRYITTAIDYPNAPPHMGHVLEKVLADSIARWWRLSGDDVRFQIGTDEHGVKIQQTADRENCSPQALVDRNAPLFHNLYDRLHISYDAFIRTTDQAVHWPTVLELWKRLQKGGALEKRTYKGLYCSGCEKFMTKKDLLDGKCPDHQKVPEEVQEENWFFLLKREGGWLQELLTQEHGYHIVPASRSYETLSLIDQGLEDVSFSRPNSSLSWGIPVPDDEDQTMYVWCDALTNYISGLGYFTDHEEKGWWEDADVTHVIGKDIARFHALIWPAMLKHAGLPVPPPHRLLIHGFITSEGQKMSKSIGNVVMPEEPVEKIKAGAREWHKKKDIPVTEEMLERYGIDALRFFLCHEIPVGNDGDFTQRNFDASYTLLSNQIGNLVNRVIVLLKKEGGEVIVSPWKNEAGSITEIWAEYTASMNGLKLRGIDHAMDLALMGNIMMDREKPWTLAAEQKNQVLGYLAELLRHIALMLLPFIPETAQNMSMQLGVMYADQMLEKTFIIKPKWKRWGGWKDWKRVGEPEILFPKVDQ